MDVCHTWSFFETGHGKGEHDGTGACVKHALRRYQMNHSASRLANSNDVVNWCKQTMGDVDISMPHNCTAIPKTRCLHSIKSKKMTNIHVIEK